MSLFKRIIFFIWEKPCCNGKNSNEKFINESSI